MKTILIINLVVAILNFTMALLLAYSAKADFVKLYSIEKLPTISRVEKIGALMRLFVIVICPIINLIFLFIYVFAWESIKEDAIDNLIEMTV